MPYVRFLPYLRDCRYAEKSTGLCEKRPVGFYRRRRGEGRLSSVHALRLVTSGRSVVGRPVGPVGPARPVGPVPLSSPLHRPSISPTDRLRAHSSRKLDGLSGGIRAEYPARRRSARPLSRLKPRGDILSSVSICPAVATIRANIDCCTNICAVTIPLSPYISRFHAAYTYRRPAHVSL